ncbi:hypothetical protein [Streptomyces sp. NPDC029003]|uniref:hypothetical protein n=1 Tax=Streptomyces sp. NPDC029003 TaxID=3155125 RepID=UPI0033ECC578
MTAADRKAAPLPRPGGGPASLFAAEAALEAIEGAVREARQPRPGTVDRDRDRGGDRSQGRDGEDDARRALACLTLLREVREELAGWETGLVEAARANGASWAELAEPLGVASRQAAERRYLRLRPGAADSTGEERVQAVRDQRAADRSITAWARANAAPLRQLAGQITALADLPAASEGRVGDVTDALAHHDAARLLAPLDAIHPDLHTGHSDLAERIDDIRRETRRLRHDSNQQRGG